MEESFKKLRDIFLLLDRDEDSSLSENDRVRKEELSDIFQHFNNCTRRLTDYFRIPRSKKRSCNLVPRFLHLLRECLLTHQWQKALKLIAVLCNEGRGQDTTLWKTGLCCLHQDEDRNERLIQQFVNHVCDLKKIAAVEVMLDYLLFLLLKLNIEDAKGLVQELKLKTAFRSQLVNERRTMAHTLFFAYQGLVLYVEWKMLLSKMDDEDDEMDFISQKLSQGATSNAARSIANSAVEYLTTIKDSPGVWDIFIARIVEIHEYYGETDQARELLISYRDRNPSNPNSHRYLYEFEQNQQEFPDTQLDCLKQIIKLDPSNNLCLKLYNLLESEEPSSITYLFDYLDYEHCCRNEDAWEALAEKLTQIPHNPELANIVNEQWDIRKHWWPQTRFKVTSRMSSQCQDSVQKVKEMLVNLEKGMEMN